MHLNKSRLRFKPEKISINSTNLTHFNQDQLTSFSSKLAVATTPSVKKAEKQRNNNTSSDQVRNWYFNEKKLIGTTSYWIKKTANFTRQTNSTSHSLFTKQMNYKLPTTKRTFFWYLKKRNLSNQTDFIYLNKNKKNRTRVVNSLTHLNNIPRLEKLISIKSDNVTHLNQVHKPRHNISNIIRPLKRKINRLIRLMKFFQKSLPLKAPNSTVF